MSEFAGYRVPATVKSSVARWMVTPFFSNVFTNFTAVGKSAWSDGMM